MKKILYFVIILLAFNVNAYSQFIQNSSRSLFSDVKAFREGDAIMVLIIEDTQADNSAKTQNDRSTSVNANLGYNTGSGNNTMGGSFGTGTGHQGRGQTSRNEKIRSRLSAKVVEVVENGNLRIEGTRTTKVNGETQTVVIKGIVRPVDVRPDNSVFSYSILELTLLIEGDGSVSEIQEPGLLTKFLRILF
ncbi:MAG: flagellar basal body L-ring protein FlgH [Candidatus Kapabacteria bacterium]|nr:flagellar basal body L-ring protein FlgH [Candidatus Kapabacteria bacterium]